MSEPGNDRSGEVIDGRYRLLDLVGRGGMADVYRAQDEFLGRIVAVKIMRLGTGIETDEAIRRHEMEARIGAGVAHPGLVGVFDVRPDGDHPYLVMEFVNGRTLDDVLRDGPMSPERGADIGAQLAEALAALHAVDVIHRDIKPSNVMLVEAHDGSTTVKLTDFGVSRYLEGTRLTSPDILVGTARYLSPEQTVLDPVGSQADVYALALVLLEALTGEQSFPGSQVETLSARLHRQPKVPAELGPGWGLLLDSMTRRNPEQRPDDLTVAKALRELTTGPELSATMMAALTDDDATVADGSLTPVTDATSTMPASTVVAPAAPDAAEPADDAEQGAKRKRGFGWAIALAIVAAVLIATGIVWWVLASDGDPDPEPTPSPTPTTTEPPTTPTPEPTTPSPEPTNPAPPPETNPAPTPRPTQPQPTQPTQPTEPSPTEPTEPSEPSPTEPTPTNDPPDNGDQNSGTSDSSQN